MQSAQRFVSEINCVVELSQQIRTEDFRYLDLLNGLINGQSTFEDYELLRTRVIGTPKLQASLQQKPLIKYVQSFFFHLLSDLL